MKDGNSMMLLGATGVGRSEMPSALDADTRRQGGDGMLVLNAADYGVPAGLSGRLLGHPAGYRTYGDDRNPPEGLLAMLALGQMQRGDQPCIFLDGDGPEQMN
jgi:hypothetical protein